MILDQWTKCRFCTGDIIGIDGAYKGGRGHVLTFYCIDSPTRQHEPEGDTVATQESSTYIVSITLQTENGELPADYEVERMVEDQMSGTLDDDTGLEAIDVTLLLNETTGRERAEMHDRDLANRHTHRVDDLEQHQKSIEQSHGTLAGHLRGAHGIMHHAVNGKGFDELKSEHSRLHT